MNIIKRIYTDWREIHSEKGVLSSKRTNASKAVNATLLAAIWLSYKEFPDVVDLWQTIFLGAMALLGATKIADAFSRKKDDEQQ